MSGDSGNPEPLYKQESVIVNTTTNRLTHGDPLRSTWKNTLRQSSSTFMFHRAAGRILKVPSLPQKPAQSVRSLDNAHGSSRTSFLQPNHGRRYCWATRTMAQCRHCWTSTNLSGTARPTNHRDSHSTNTSCPVWSGGLMGLGRPGETDPRRLDTLLVSLTQGYYRERKHQCLLSAG